MEKETYRDCMRNHAATLGTYATDGCGEYTPPDSTSSSSTTTNLLCAACGCHRNFHRKVTSASSQPLLLRYSPDDHRNVMASSFETKKRTRTKFTSDQKEKMTRFAEKIGWRIPRRVDGGEDKLGSFCREVGVSRQVFKVWMHNHKSSSNSHNSPTTSSAPVSSSPVAEASESPSMEHQ